MKKSFSLLELIVVIVILSIIVTVAIPKFTTGVEKSNLVKIKSDIMLIRTGINGYKDKAILKAQDLDLETLEDDSNYLFSKVLTYPIKPTSTPKAASWEKISNESYRVWIDSQSSVIFYYDLDNSTFDCDFKEQFCKELTQ